MKTMRFWMMAAMLFCGMGCLVSCNGNTDAAKTAEDTAVVFRPIKSGDVVMDAVNQYLVDSIGSHYAKGDICIPVVVMTCTEGINADSVFKWGDYWVFNYKMVGDTLKCVSGGSHPGKMLLRKKDIGEYQVVSFEQVEDGSGNVESAKRIFGNCYNAFHAINSDESYRERARASSIADYVKEYKLPVKYYQDFGWPAKPIPTKR